MQNLGMSAVTIAKSLGVTDKTVVKAISWVRLTTVSAHSDTKSLGGARAISQSLDSAGYVGTNRSESISVAIDAPDGYNSHPRVGQWGSLARITRLGGSRDGAPREQGFP